MASASSSVIDVLRLGISGLVFLFAGFVYRLLLKEQNRTNPRAAILKSVRFFAWMLLAMSALVGGLSLVEKVYSRPIQATPVAPAQQVAECRRSLLRLGAAGRTPDADQDDLRGNIRNHVGVCDDLLRSLANQQLGAPSNPQ